MCAYYLSWLIQRGRDVVVDDGCVVLYCSDRFFESCRSSTDALVGAAESLCVVPSWQQIEIA